MFLSLPEIVLPLCSVLQICSAFKPSLNFLLWDSSRQESSFWASSVSYLDIYPLPCLHMPKGPSYSSQNSTGPNTEQVLSQHSLDHCPITPPHPWRDLCFSHSTTDTCIWSHFQVGPIIGLQSSADPTPRITCYGSMEDMRAKASNRLQNWVPQWKWRRKFDNR